MTPAASVQSRKHDLKPLGNAETIRHTGSGVRMNVRNIILMAQFIISGSSAYAECPTWGSNVVGHSPKENVAEVEQASRSESAQIRFRAQKKKVDEIYDLAAKYGYLGSCTQSYDSGVGWRMGVTLYSPHCDQGVYLIGQDGEGVDPAFPYYRPDGSFMPLILPPFETISDWGDIDVEEKPNLFKKATGYIVNRKYAYSKEFGTLPIEQRSALYRNGLNVKKAMAYLKEGDSVGASNELQKIAKYCSDKKIVPGVKARVSLPANRTSSPAPVENTAEFAPAN